MINYNGPPTVEDWPKIVAAASAAVAKTWRHRFPGRSSVGGLAAHDVAMDAVLSVWADYTGGGFVDSEKNPIPRDTYTVDFLAKVAFGRARAKIRDMGRRQWSELPDIEDEGNRQDDHLTLKLALAHKAELVKEVMVSAKESEDRDLFRMTHFIVRTGITQPSVMQDLRYLSWCGQSAKMFDFFMTKIEQEPHDVVAARLQQLFGPNVKEKKEADKIRYHRDKAFNHVKAVGKDLFPWWTEEVAEHVVVLIGQCAKADQARRAG
jgi:hypothetical protein